MIREKAIERIKARFDKWALDDEDMKAIQAIIPELAESQDKKIIQFFAGLATDACGGPGQEYYEELGLNYDKVMAWLKKQKEQNDKAEEYADFTIYHPLKNAKGEYECIPYSFYDSLTSFSEDKDLIDFLRTCFYTKEECNEWIEQQKEQPKEELVYRLNGLMQEYIKEGKDGAEKEHRFKCYQLFWDALEDANFFEQKEQKPTELSGDTTPVRFEEEDGEKYPVVDYKLIGRKPTEWNKDDEKMLNNLIWAVHMKSISPCDEMDDGNVYEKYEKFLKSLRSKSSSQSNINHTVWHNASEEKPTKLPIIHIWYHGNRVDAVTHEDTCLQTELDDINFQPDDKWAYVEDLLNVQPSWKPSEQEKGALRTAIYVLTNERNFPKTAAQLQNILNAFEGEESRKD